VETEKTFIRDGAKKRDQETGKVMPGYEGAIYFTASNKARPRLVDPATNEVSEDQGYFVTGAICNVHIDVWAQKNQHGQRVNAQVLGLQFVRHGEGGGGGFRKSRAEDFDVLEQEFTGGAGEGLADADAFDDDVSF
jgi:hypothetical protein